MGNSSYRSVLLAALGVGELWAALVILHFATDAPAQFNFKWAAMYALINGTLAGIVGLASGFHGMMRRG